MKQDTVEPALIINDFYNMREVIDVIEVNGRLCIKVD